MKKKNCLSNTGRLGNIKVNKPTASIVFQINFLKSPEVSWCLRKNQNVTHVQSHYGHNSVPSPTPDLDTVKYNMLVFVFFFFFFFFSKS